MIYWQMMLAQSGSGNPAAAGMAAGLARLAFAGFVAALLRGFLKAGIVAWLLRKSGEKLAGSLHPFGVSIAIYCTGTVVIITGTFLLLRSFKSFDGGVSLFLAFGGMFLLGSLIETAVMIRVLKCSDGAALLAWGIDPFWLIALLCIGW